MLTKLESNVIKSMLTENLHTNLVSLSADKTTMKVGADVNRLLDYFLRQYKRESKDTKIGKSAYLWILLKKFRDEQLALLRYSDINQKLFDKSMLTALQTFKKIMKDYVDRSINSQSEAVVALLMYSAVRRYELDNDFKVTDYLDDEYENDMLELKGYNMGRKKTEKVKTREDMLEQLEELFEESKPVATKFSLRSDK